MSVYAHRNRAHLQACLQDLRDIAIADLGAVATQFSDGDVLAWTRRRRA